MTFLNWFAVGVFSLGGILLAYSFYLYIRYLKPSVDNSASKKDINDLQNVLTEKINRTNQLLEQIAKNIDKGV